MKKILILGGSHRDIPLIQAAQALGLHVITLGDRDYYIGHNFSNQSYRIDFNNIAKISNLIQELKIDFLCPGCSEQALKNTVILSEKHMIGNFDSLEKLLLLHDKAKFKEFCLNNKISTPMGVKIDNLNDIYKIDIFFPLIVKPVNLSGGNGVFVVRDIKELEVAISKAQNVSKREDVLVEEFIEGDLIAYSTFIKNKKAMVGFIAKDNTYLNDYLITTSYPIDIPIDIVQGLNKDIEKICNLLDLKDGPFHFQVLIRDDRPYIVDVTRRIPGDLFPFLIEFCTGVKYSENVINALIGENVREDDLKTKKYDYFIRHCIMPDSNGIFMDTFIAEELKPKLFYELYLTAEGAKIDNYLRHQIGIVFIKFDSKYEMVNTAQQINSFIYPEII